MASVPLITPSKNLNEKTNAEIEGFLKKSKEELFNLRFQHATGQLENTARLKAVKSDIARMYTVLRERGAWHQPWSRPLPNQGEVIMAEERNFRKVRRGYVVSDKMDKTITVELEQRSTHPLCTGGSFVPPARSRPMMNTTTPVGDLVSIMGNSASEQDQALASRIHYRARQVSKVRQGSPFTGHLGRPRCPGKWGEIQLG